MPPPPSRHYRNPRADLGSSSSSRFMVLAAGLIVVVLGVHNSQQEAPGREQSTHQVIYYGGSMAEEKTITTGQVSGLLGIPIVTIQRYVREHRDYFSPEAARNTRGRRWSPDDVNRLVIIRSMHQAQVGNEKISAALENYKASSGNQQTTSYMDAVGLLVAAGSILDEVREEKKQIQELLKYASWKAKEYEGLPSWVQRKFTLLDKDIAEIRRGYEHLTFIYKNPLRRYEVAEQWKTLYPELLDKSREWLGNWHEIIKRQLASQEAGKDD